mgnify:FL=1
MSEASNRVREAFARYEAAQREQAGLVLAMNEQGERGMAAVHYTVQTGDVAEALRSRSQSLAAEARFNECGARVFAAAGDLVDALDGAGFGDTAPAAEGGAT